MIRDGGHFSRGRDWARFAAEEFSVGRCRLVSVGVDLCCGLSRITADEQTAKRKAPCARRQGENKKQTSERKRKRTIPRYPPSTAIEIRQMRVNGLLSPALSSRGGEGEHNAKVPYFNGGLPTLLGVRTRKPVRTACLQGFSNSGPVS